MDIENVKVKDGKIQGFGGYLYREVEDCAEHEEEWRDGRDERRRSKGNSFLFIE